MTSTSRTRNLGLAAGLAVVATALTAVYVSGSQDSATAAPAVSSTPVLVAARDLAVGTPIAQAISSGAVVTKRLPAEAVTPSAVTNPAALRGDVVIQPIFKDEQITAGRFGPSGAQGLRANLHGPLRAIAVSGDSTQLLASTLQAGDHVDVVANVRAIEGTSSATRIVLRDLLVLAPPTSGGAPGSSTTSATLQLTDREVQTLFWVLKNGDWSFVLRPAAKAQVTALAPATAQTVLEGR
jgi:Flp pilus assembly protein CpaB